MRILSIRGENLASLAAPFELDLEHEPFASSRIFAIVGPTGAGKSTLLDALCLALFHRTPRLSERSGGVDVGEDGERIKSYDPRGLLHRGAATAFAECDFESTLGRFRARWSVRRARGKAQGRIQNAKVSLTNLEDGVAIGRTTTEVREAITERLGLSFEQFRRSVLLAQGDFAAFLRAGGDERAALLERMTATPIYAALSVAAHEKAKDEATKLERDRAVLRARAPLAPAERARLETRSAKASALLQTLDGQVRELRERCRVLERDRELEGALTRALNEEKRLRSESARFDTAEMKHARAVLALSELFERSEGAEKNEQARDAALKDARKTRDTASERQRALLVRQEVQRTKRAAFEASLEAFESALEAAGELDAALAAEGSARAQLLGAVESTQSELDQAKNATLQCDTKLAALRSALEDEATWLAARPYREGGDVRGARDARMRALEHAQAALAADDAVAEAAERYEALRLGQLLLREECTAGHADLEARSSHFEAALEASRQVLRDEALRAFVDAAEKAEEARSASERARSDLERSTVELAAAGNALTLAASEVARAEQELDDARRAAAALALQVGAQQLRDHLVDGEPCPVCGGRDHDDAPAPVPGDALPVADARVKAMEAALEAARASRTAAQEREQHARTSVHRTQSAFGESDTQRRHAESRRAEALAALEAAQSACSDDAAWRRLIVGIPQTLAELGALGGASPEPIEPPDGARLHDLRIRQAAKEEALRAHETKVHVARAQLLEANAERAPKGPRAEVAAREAAARIGEDWSSDEAEADLEADVRIAPERRTQRDELARQRDALTQSRAALEERQRAASMRLRDLRSQLDARNAAYAALEKKRGALLEGSSVASARSTRAKRDADLRAAEAELAEHAATAAEAEGAATMLLEARVEELTRASSQRASLERSLDARLAEIGLEKAKALAIRNADVDWNAKERAANAAQRALTRASAQVDQRRRDRRALHGEHPAIFGVAAAAVQQALFAEGGEPPSLEEAQAELGDSVATREALKTELDVDRARLREDEKARSHGDEESKELARRAEELVVWQELAALIGSADGKRFRAFAQSLSLDILLGRANAQLARLFPRYRLARAPGSDLGLQAIDLDMGGVSRSIDTLSGGETFVVSLALALALSGLSAQRAPLQTLFIDEGFGALDAQSLEDVLDVLDAVQAEGKQIGVISHVGDIAERFRVRVEVLREREGRSQLRVVPAPEELKEAQALTTPQ